jgi:hypothetical protein
VGVIKPRVDLDDEQTRLLTYDQAHAASVEHLGLVAAAASDVSSTIVGRDVASDVDEDATDQFADEMTDELAYRAALAALSGVVQRSLRDFLS